MIITIDIGGTAIKTGFMQDGKLTTLAQYPTDPKRENFSMLATLDNILDDILAQYPEAAGVALSSAGVIDHQQGRVAFANENIPGYKGTELAAHIEATYHLPCSVDNDVNCALMGELSLPRYQAVDSALMFTIGTGVGGAVYLNGDLYRGPTFSAGEVGYSIINGQPIERVASTTALVAYVKERVDETVRDDVDGKWIFAQAKDGHAICQEGIEWLVHHLTTHIVNTVSLLNPEVVILGGGIMEQVDYLRPLIDTKFKELYQNTLVLRQTEIAFAQLGNRAGMIGAYEVFKTKHPA